MWNRSGDPMKDVPMCMGNDTVCSAEYQDFEIAESWTVILDAAPVLKTLKIRGTLIFPSNPGKEIGLHAFDIEIFGGRLTGTWDDPFVSSYPAFIEMHGDVYVHGKESRDHIACNAQSKKVNGELSLIAKQGMRTAE